MACATTQEVICGAAALRQTTQSPRASGTDGAPPARAQPAASASLHHPSRPSSGLAANCGVFVGIAYNEYIGMVAAHGGVSTYTATGGSLSVAAGEQLNPEPDPDCKVAPTSNEHQS